MWGRVEARMATKMAEPKEEEIEAGVGGGANVWGAGALRVNRREERRVG